MIDQQVDNAKLGAGANPYTFHTGPSAKALAAGATTIQSEEAVIKSTLDLIRREHTHRLLVDFDDHLEDPYVQLRQMLIRQANAQRGRLGGQCAGQGRGEARGRIIAGKILKMRNTGVGVAQGSSAV